MDKRGPAPCRTVLISILAFLLLSLVGHYVSDVFPTAFPDVDGGMQDRAREVSSMTIDTQVSHPLHSALRLEEPIALGILLGLTYAIITSSSNYKFRALPPLDRPPTPETYSF